MNPLVQQLKGFVLRGYLWHNVTCKFMLQIFDLPVYIFCVVFRIGFPYRGRLQPVVQFFGFFHCQLFFGQRFRQLNAQYFRLYFRFFQSIILPNSRVIEIAALVVIVAATVAVRTCRRIPLRLRGSLKLVL